MIGSRDPHGDPFAEASIVPGGGTGLWGKRRWIIVERSRITGEDPYCETRDLRIDPPHACEDMIGDRRHVIGGSPGGIGGGCDRSAGHRAIRDFHGGQARSIAGRVGSGVQHHDVPRIFKYPEQKQEKRCQ